MIIYGASGHGKVILNLLRKCGFEQFQFIDDGIKKDWGYGNVISPKEIGPFIDEPAVIAIGSNHQRKKVSLKYLLNYQSAIHPQSILAIPHSYIGPGTVIMAGVVVNPEVKIGKHVILNTSCCIEHECIIEDFVHVSPNATLCGKVSVFEGAHIGAGAVVIQGVKVGKWSTVGAGAVVINDVPDYAAVVGNPAKVIKIDKLGVEFFTEHEEREL
jgi:sugar O-acyltransferase (sialic acid O-acetyltransferase NeuD family)